MSSTRRPGPDEMPPQPGQDPAVDALLDYLASTAVTPPADLTARIQARVEREPDRTPPRRYVLALLHLRLGTAAGAFRQLVRVTSGQGRTTALMRAQALSLVLITVLSATVVVAGAAMGITQLVQDRRAPTVPTMVPDPDRISTPSPDLETPGPTDADTDRLAEPTPRRSDRTPRPDATRRPSKTADPDREDGSEPKATRRPTRTPKPTERPKAERTPKPERTPRRTERPESTEHPEPTESPEDEGDGEDGGADDAGDD